jgi:Fanconi anemia group M protein
MSLLDINQSSLMDFAPDESLSVRIVVDTREFNSNVSKRLAQSNVKIDSLQLGAGDYILSERVAVERKRTEDLLESLIDGRLFVQLKKLKALYLNPILIIEGQNLFSDKSINPSALSGALASIVTDFRIPIINTKNERETVKLLIALARREQADKKSHFGLRTDKSTFSDQEQKQFIIEGLPNVSSVLAQRLLAHFGTVKRIFDASVEELCEVKGVGKKTAEEIRKVIDDAYQ